VRAGAARVDDALGNALVVEMEDLLAEDEILEQRRTAGAEPQAVLVVGDRRPVVRRQDAAGTLPCGRPPGAFRAARSFSLARLGRGRLLARGAWHEALSAVGR
jgi:hypothetical protein